MKLNVVFAKLITMREDMGGYIVYVFELPEGKLPYDKYIMCTRFPNWESPMLKINDTGYLKYKEVMEGKDTWFDGNDLIPYKYTGIHFIDFVYDKKPLDEIIL